MAPEQIARFERKKEMRHGDADAFSLSYLLKKPEESEKKPIIARKLRPATAKDDAKVPCNRLNSR